MHIQALLRWWYGAGWKDQLDSAALWLAKVSDFFSIPLLLKTLFQPFRQQDTGAVQGAFEVQLRAWLDNLLSRFIGAMVRTFMIVVGGLWWFISATASACWLLAWPLLPVAPLLGVVLAGSLSL